MTSQKVIEILRTKINEIVGQSTVEQYNIWKDSTSITLQKLLPNEVSLIQKFEQNGATRHFMSDMSNVDQAKQKAKSLLETAIDNIEHHGIESIKEPLVKGGDIHINVSQSVDQQVSQQIEINLKFILEAFKYELTKEQISELKKIHESSDSPAGKKRRFFEKLGMFGTDVAAGILSGILSNQMIVDRLFS